VPDVRLRIFCRCEVELLTSLSCSEDRRVNDLDGTYHQEQQRRDEIKTSVVETVAHQERNAKYCQDHVDSYHKDEKRVKQFDGNDSKLTIEAKNDLQQVELITKRT